MPTNQGCATIVKMASGMNSTRQQTFTIVGSVAGTVLAATIAIATLIVLQHDSMRRSSSAQIESVRSALSAEIESVRNAAGSEHASLRGDTVEIRDDMREVRGDIRVMRADISDLRERMAQVEVHVGAPADNR